MLGVLSVRWYNPPDVSRLLTIAVVDSRKPINGGSEATKKCELGGELKRTVRAAVDDDNEG